jgi:hypothetical protein
VDPNDVEGTGANWIGNDEGNTDSNDVEDGGMDPNNIKDGGGKANDVKDQYGAEQVCGGGCLR